MASRHRRRAAEPLEFLERYGREYFDELDARKVTLKSRIKDVLLWLSTPAPGYPLNLVSQQTSQHLKPGQENTNT
jgi:hypothetical protein